MSDSENKTIYQSAMSHAAYWLRDTTPLHKFLDVLILFIASSCALGLYVAYNSEEQLLGIVSSAMSRYPSLDIGKVEAGFEGAWADAVSYGGVAIEVYEVDLSNNQRTLVRWKAVDSELERAISDHRRRPLLDPAYDARQVAIIADVITGDPSIGKRSAVLPEYMGLYVPIPDAPGQNLCGLVVVSFPPDYDKHDISLLRAALLSYTEQLTK